MDQKISEFVDGGLVQTTDEVASNRAGVNTKIFFGDAAALDYGTGVGDLVQIVDVGGNPGLPALDGSLLTNVGGQADLVRVSVSDDTAGYLDDKIDVNILLTKNTITDSAGDESISLEVRSLITSSSVSSGTHTVNIANGDFHKITATGVFTFGWSMAEGQSVLVRGINFDTYNPIDNLEWGDAGEPAWTGKDDFVVYRDMDGDYIGAVIALGIA